MLNLVQAHSFDNLYTGVEPESLVSRHPNPLLTGRLATGHDGVRQAVLVSQPGWMLAETKQKKGPSENLTCFPVV